MSADGRRRRSVPLRASAFVLLSSLLLLASCARDEKVLNYKPFFAGLEGVKTETPASSQRQKSPIANPEPEADPNDPTKFALIRDNPNGTKTAISKSGLQLMKVIQKCLADNLDQLFAEQVLSQITQDEFKDRGMDPREGFKALKAREKEIAKLFSRMPLGEHSPNVSMQSIGKNMFRVKVTGRSVEGLDPWTGFDMVLEKGNWRLRWFVH